MASRDAAGSGRPCAARETLEQMRCSMVTAVVCQKGGVGKTTTAVNAAVALASEGDRRVLVVDLDQGHAGKALGAACGTGLDIADVVWEGRAVEDVIRREPRVARIDVIAGSKAMADYDLELADAPDRFDVLSSLLEPVRHEYDHILLDLPPGRGLVHAGAYMAADWILAPVIPEVDAVDGLVDLQESLERAESELGAPARLVGILVTMVDVRTREHRDNIAELREVLGSQVLDSTIRTTTRVREAAREQVSVLEHSPDCTAARDYRAAANEIVNRMARGA